MTLDQKRRFAYHAAKYHHHRREALMLLTTRPVRLFYGLASHRDKMAEVRQQTTTVSGSKPLDPQAEL